MKEPSKDFKVRYAAAKKWRDDVEKNIKDALQFCSPGREHDFDVRPTQHRTIAEIFTSTGETLASDLAGDFVTYYTPPEERWLDMKVEVAIERRDEKRIQSRITDREDTILSMVQASNYYDIAPQVWFEAAAHGTMAMWVEQSHLMQPLYVETVPPHELLITPGHQGVLDRFREKWVANDFLKATFSGQDVDLNTRKINEKMNDKSKPLFKVCWGFWLDWVTDPVAPRWLHEITVDGERVSEEKAALGQLAGACPLLVGRFNPQVNRPWGRGPGTRAIPELLTLDGVSEKVLYNLDANLDPAWAYPDDGGMDFINGIRSGHAYPVKPNSADALRRLDLGGDLDYGWFQEERIEQKLRSIFYQDGPRQRGDTPPSATQWLEEARRVQRRLGKPSAPLWTEFVEPFIKRVEFIGVEIGKIDQTFTHNGEVISLTPVSPLQSAQNETKAMIARSNVDTIAQWVGPENVPSVVDMKGTITGMIRATGDEITQLVEEKETTPDAPAAPQA